MINEYAVLALISAGGICIAWLLGIRSLWLAVPAGLMIDVVIRILVFSTLNMIHQRWLAGFIFFGVMGLGLLAAAWKARGGVYKNVLLGIAFSVLAVTSTRVIGIKPVEHGDSLWILSFTRLFDMNGDIAALDGHTAIKRGFAYPLMLSLGPNREYLSGMTPYIFAALACLVFWLSRELLRGQQKGRTIVAVGLGILLYVSAVMPMRAIFYVNGHTLTAVGMLAAAAVTVLAVRDQKLDNSQVLIACLGTFTAATSRIEGIALVALVVLPLLSQKFITRRQIIAIISAATFGLSIWLATYHSYIINATHLPWYVFMAVLVGGGMLPALKIFDWFRFRIMSISLIAMVVVFVAAQVIFAHSLKKGNISLVSNLIIGDGRWGGLLGAFIIAILLGRLKNLTTEHKTLLWLTAALILGSLITKMLDGGQFGHPTLGRVGWSDSLNRMWWQSYAIFIVTALVGLLQHDRLWGVKEGSEGKTQ